MGLCKSNFFKAEGKDEGMMKETSRQKERKSQGMSRRMKRWEWGMGKACV